MTHPTLWTPWRQAKSTMWCLFILGGPISVMSFHAVHATKKPVDSAIKQALEKDTKEALEKDKADFLKKMKQSSYYSLDNSLQEASDDYLYLAKLLSEYNTEKTIDGISIKDLTKSWTECLLQKVKETHSPASQGNNKNPLSLKWDQLLLDIAQKVTGGQDPFANRAITDIILKYDLMSFCEKQPIAQENRKKDKDTDERYTLLNDWSIVLFHGGEQTVCGRGSEQRTTTRQTELKQNFQWMERSHDYVQIWYPIFSISKHEPGMPRMSPSLYNVIQHNESVQTPYKESIRTLFHKTLAFMGLEYSESDKKIKEKKSNEKVDNEGSMLSLIENWSYPGRNQDNHNFLRINRYLQALDMMNLHDERDAFLRYLEEYETHCKNASYTNSLQNFWKKAAAENQGYVAKETLAKDKADFLEQMKQSTYYSLDNSRQEASDDYLYLAKLLSEYNTGKKIDGIGVQVLTKSWTECLLQKVKETHSPASQGNNKNPLSLKWDSLLLDIAQKVIDGQDPFANRAIKDIILNYDLMSFCKKQPIAQESRKRDTDTDKKYTLLNDWSIMLFHGGEQTVCGRGSEQRTTTRQTELKQNFQWMERSHDYVQIWYPIFSISASHADMPRMSPSLYNVIQCHDVVKTPYKESIRTLFHKTLAFMGLQYSEGDKKINEKVDNEGSMLSLIENWSYPGCDETNHNFLRINRYLQALDMMNLHDERDAFLRYLEEYNTNCKNASYTKSLQNFWKKAAAENQGYVEQATQSDYPLNPSLVKALQELATVKPSLPTMALTTPAGSMVSAGSASAPARRKGPRKSTTRIATLKKRNTVRRKTIKKSRQRPLKRHRR